jgi:polyhydroxyalkanoate synthesis regulator phasin
MTSDFAREVIDRLARIEEQARAAKEAADTACEAAQHRHANLRMTIEGLATKKDLEAIEERVESLEGSRDWVVKAVFGAWVAGTGVVAFFTNKLT